MKNIILRVPDEMKMTEEEVASFLAAKLYESGKLSLGQAAALVSKSKVDFAEMLGQFNVSLFNYPASEIKRDATAF